MYKHYIKRLIDIFVAGMVLIVLLPFLTIIYLLVKIDSKGPFFFFQERLGYKGQIFKVYKIRTMTDRPRISDREIFKGDTEVTKVGYWLRRFKIDELPQLINIVIGDMSLVGPRPALPRQIEEFNEDGKMRVLVRPGLTGLAQVNGNIHLSWEQRWQYDRKYVEQLSFWMDLKIILKTILIIFFGEEKFLKSPNA